MESWIVIAVVIVVAALLLHILRRSTPLELAIVATDDQQPNSSASEPTPQKRSISQPACTRPGCKQYRSARMRAQQNGLSGTLPLRRCECRSRS